MYRRLGELQKTDGEAIHNETLLEHLEVQGKESFWHFVDILCTMKGKFRDVGEELRPVSTDGLEEQQTSAGVEAGASGWHSVPQRHRARGSTAPTDESWIWSIRNRFQKVM